MMTHTGNSENKFMSLVAEMAASLEIIKKYRKDIDDLLAVRDVEQKKFKELEYKLDKLESRQPINPVITSLITQLRRRYIIKLLGGKESPAYQNKKLTQAVFRQAALDFKKEFKVPRYDLVKQKDEELAKNFWTTWLPNEGMLRRIEELNNY